jgi:hypothetical protein
MLRNNLISISQQTTGTKAGLVLGAISTVTTAFDSDYNIIWVPGGNVALKNPTTPTYYPTIADWQVASTQDANSFSLDAMFVSSTLPQPTSAAADNLGTPVAGITTDVLGITRGATPDIGAYEFPSSTGIENVLQEEKQIFYPNPFSNSLNIMLNNNLPSEIILYNAISGKQMLRTIISPASIDTKDLPQGIYFYEVRSSNEVTAKGKIVKQ